MQQQRAAKDLTGMESRYVASHQIDCITLISSGIYEIYEKMQQMHSVDWYGVSLTRQEQLPPLGGVYYCKESLCFPHHNHLNTIKGSKGCQHGANDHTYGIQFNF